MIKERIAHKRIIKNIFYEKISRVVDSFIYLNNYFHKTNNKKKVDAIKECQLFAFEAKK